MKNERSIAPGLPTGRVVADNWGSDNGTEFWLTTGKWVFDNSIRDGSFGRESISQNGGCDSGIWDGSFGDSQGIQKIRRF